MSDHESTAAAHKLIAGWLCLDFANTVEPRHAQAERDYLHDYADLVDWAEHAGTLDSADAARLTRAADAQPADVRACFARAIALREAIYRLFSDIAAGKTPPSGDVDTVERAYAEAMQHAHLRLTDGRFAWTWADGDLDRPWWPIARSAIELATEGPTDRIKLCPTDQGCAWLFVDTTKNRSRRWCSMEDCGSFVKARRQTDRRRAARHVRTGRPL